MIEPGALVLADSSVILAYLTGTEAVSLAATRLFDAFAATGRNPVAISAVSVLEVLVRPFRAGSTAVARAEGFLRHFAELRVIDADYAVGREAARIRASTGLPAPDSLIIASGVVAGVDIIATIDGDWSRAIDALGASIQICDLSLLAA